MIIIYCILSFIWEEVIFHISIYGSIDKYILFPVILSIPVGMLLGIVCSLFPKKVNKVISVIGQGVMSVFFCAQVIYHHIFDTFLVLKSITNGAGQATDFMSTIMAAIRINIIPILGLLVPFIALVIIYIVDIKKHFSNIERLQLKSIGVLIASLIVILFVGRLSLNIYGYGAYSPYEIYYTPNMMEQSMNKLGVITTTYKDINTLVYKAFDINKKYNKKLTGKKVVDNIDLIRMDFNDDSGMNYKPNIIDIDFSGLCEVEDNKEILDMHIYFSNVAPTSKNDYTGMFEGYNLIFITAESFSGYLIDKDRTPTLYKMYNEGFKFNNFYNPSWYLSTIDGEYVNLLGQIPVDGDWSFQHASDNWSPFALGNQLNNLGYSSYAYHNHDAYYYDRTILHPTLGYDFKAVDSGLTFSSKYPESDLELMEITYEEYMNEEPFNAYYMTMSGHLPYTYGYNSMACKHEDEIEGLKIYKGDDIKPYIEANMEFENAVAYLVNKAEEKGVLDNTLFVIVPDHYPYGLKKGSYNEFSGNDVEDDPFELYRSKMIIWSSSMEKGIEVDKYCSSMDILPTVSNLLGLSYDSRLLAGRDVLSDCEALVMFKDRSFITDKIKYNAMNGEVIYLSEDEASETYISQKIKEVNDRFKYSKNILDNDYYSIVTPKDQK